MKIAIFIIGVMDLFYAIFEDTTRQDRTAHMSNHENHRYDNSHCFFHTKTVFYALNKDECPWCKAATHGLPFLSLLLKCLYKPLRHYTMAKNE